MMKIQYHIFSITGKLSVTTYLPGVSMSLAHQIADPKPLGPWHSKTRVRAPNNTSQKDSSLIEISNFQQKNVLNSRWDEQNVGSSSDE